jgi:hypothetical protein
MDCLVKWEIDSFDVATPLEAAMKARKAQNRPGTIATVFTVYPPNGADPIRVDLEEQAEEGKIHAIPQPPSISRRELASVLHALRMMQEKWKPVADGRGCQSLMLQDIVRLRQQSSISCCDLNTEFCNQE